MARALDDEIVFDEIDLTYINKLFNLNHRMASYLHTATVSIRPAAIVLLSTCSIVLFVAAFQSAQAAPPPGHPAGESPPEQVPRVCDVVLSERADHPICGDGYY